MLSPPPALRARTGGLALLLLAAWAGVTAATPQGAPPGPAGGAGAGPPASDISFSGLHGGVYPRLRALARPLGLRTAYLARDLGDDAAKVLGRTRCLLVQHLGPEHRSRYRALFRRAKRESPALRILAISDYVRADFPTLTRDGILEHDPRIQTYYERGGDENLRRLLAYVAATVLGRAGAVQPPLEMPAGGLYHPDHPSRFPDAASFLAWAKTRGPGWLERPRVVIIAHHLHLILQQPKVVDALVRALERRGALAAGLVDGTPTYERDLCALHPDLVIHTCHSRDTTDLRKRLGVVHLASCFQRKQDLARWETSTEGLPPGAVGFLVTSQELLGTIEPQVTCGTRSAGSGDAFVPIPERIDHLADRARAWWRLRRLPNQEKKVAIVYYDRDLSQASLMRGSATGMFLNAPRSLVKVLERLQRDGYQVDPVPEDARELIGWMQARGRRIGLWDPEAVRRLARSGEAVLVPEDRYRRWFEARIPKVRRQAVIQRWGPPPGRIMVWEHDGQRDLVIPRIDLGNVCLLPQPLRGEAHDTSLLHDRTVPPPHSYLATYFWLEEGYHANALVHFGTHGSELLLPGKGVGLSRFDWPDRVIGRLPNLTLWVINNLGESSPARRRAYALLVDYLTAPNGRAGLADGLRTLHDDLTKWSGLGAGALRKGFAEQITKQVRALHLGPDLHLEVPRRAALSDDALRKVAAHLHTLAEATIPTRLHVLGDAPPESLLPETITVCLGMRFAETLGTLFARPGSLAGELPGEASRWRRKRAEAVVHSVVRTGLSFEDAIRANHGHVAAGGLPKPVREGLEEAKQLADGFRRAPEEIDRLLDGLAGRFIPPGPGNSPDRNPQALPTGRNLYLLNPEQVPSRASWALGKQLADDLLKDWTRRTGRYPKQVAFTLSSFATFQDYGVMESQILRLVGVEPIWDRRNRVRDVRVVPREELGRPRVDVFLALGTYYRDMLPGRMRLLDTALRKVARELEPDNPLRLHSRRIGAALRKGGASPEQAAALAGARMFGYAPGQMGSAAYYYLVERSGDWDSRDELIDIYIEKNGYAYTEGHWGEHAPQAYAQAIQDAEAVVRTWVDRSRSPLSNKYAWYQGGSLSLAVKRISGRTPRLLLSDVRDADQARMVDAADALRADFRTRLFNRRWIEAMMREGYAGADQVAKHVSNAYGWVIMREKSVPPELWGEIVEIYVRDKRDLRVREWFEATNPHAFQELTEVMLEAIRKGYWRAEPAMVREIAEAHARSVARHGESGGLLGAANEKLHRFVSRALGAPGDERLAQLRARYLAQVRARDAAPAARGALAKADPQPPAPPAAARTSGFAKRVSGPQLRPKPEEAAPTALRWRIPAAAALLLALAALGYRRRSGAVGPKGDR